MALTRTFPEVEIGYFAKLIASEIDEYFKNPENMRRFEKWKSEKQKRETLKSEKGEIENG